MSDTVVGKVLLAVLADVEAYEVDVWHVFFCVTSVANFIIY